MTSVQKIFHIRTSLYGVEGGKLNKTRTANYKFLRDKAVNSVLRETDCLENQDCGEGAVCECLISRSLMSFSLRNVFSVEKPLFYYYLCVI